MTLSHNFFSALLALFCLNIIQAQDLNLPLQSPKARMIYTIGFTEIDIRYSSPAVHERTIWGSLVPYDEVWRAGANEATSISFSTDVNIEGTLLEKGVYSFFLIPKKGDKWTAIFNRDVKQWGTANYQNEDDVARVEVPVKFTNTSQERLHYDVIDQTADQGYIKLSWEKARVYVRFLVDVLDEAMTNVDDALESAQDDQKWIIYAKGADFLLTTGKQLDQALEWAEESTERENRCYNWWVKAQILAKKELYREAIDAGRKSINFGQTESQDRFFSNHKNQMKGLMDEWVSMVQ